jgi:hypothetical protein
MYISVVKTWRERSAHIQYSGMRIFSQTRVGQRWSVSCMLCNFRSRITSTAGAKIYGKTVVGSYESLLMAGGGNSL